VERDYAVFSSKYTTHNAESSAHKVTLTASRHIHFLLREVPAARAADYKAFLHAVQNDEAQDFVLERPVAAEEQGKPAETKTSTPAKP